MNRVTVLECMHGNIFVTIPSVYYKKKISLNHKYKTRCFEAEITTNKTELHPTQRGGSILSTAMKRMAPTTTTLMNHSQAHLSQLSNLKLIQNSKFAYPK